MIFLIKNIMLLFYLIMFNNLFFIDTNVKTTKKVSIKIKFLHDFFI